MSNRRVLVFLVCAAIGFGAALPLVGGPSAPTGNPGGTGVGLTGGGIEGPTQGGEDPQPHAMPPVFALSASVALRSPFVVWDGVLLDTQRAMASTTKMMTAILIIERTQLSPLDPDFISINTVVTASAAAAGVGGSLMGLAAGDQVALFDLLYGMMLPSGNDAAMAIAELVSGPGAGANGGAFSLLMDARAAVLGMVNTNFANPHGRDAPGHWSSVRDLVILGEYAMRNPLFRTIVDTAGWQTTTWVDSLNNPKDTVLCNTNRLIRDGTLGCPVSGYLYPGAEGIKTGTTSDAGNSLVFASTRQGKSVMGAVLNSTDGTDTRYIDATAILDYGFGAITSECSAAADAVVSYTPGPGAGVGFDDPSDALGDPDGGVGGLGESVSLGNGGSLVLEFADNGLIDHNGPDLAVYEDPGVDESVGVEVSEDGISWTSLGILTATGTFDLDGFGVSVVHFVRLTDQNEGLTAAPSAGYDVDAVRAVNWKCPPEADAGVDHLQECTGFDGADVALDGSASTDPDTAATDTMPPGVDESIAQFDWYEDYGLFTETLLGSGEILPVTLSLGIHHITLVTTDPWGLQDTDEMTVEVVDTTAPTISISADPPELWPPNHKYVQVTFDVDVEDICDPDPTFELLSAVSDEPDNDRGDGNTVNDILGADIGTPDTEVMLRSERSGRGDGRTYTITYEASDVSGNKAQASVEVYVPHDRGPP